MFDQTNTLVLYSQFIVAHKFKENIELHVLFLLSILILVFRFYKFKTRVFKDFLKSDVARYSGN